MFDAFPAASRRLLRAILFTCLAFASSCLYPKGDGRVFVTSDPPGAEIWLDGGPTGKTTPASLDLGGPLAGDHLLEIRKKGYEPETRRLTAFKGLQVVRLDDGVTDFIVPPFPAWWTFGDLFFPLSYEWRYVPHDLFVRLFPDGTFRRSGETRPASGK